jgi:hypothetical protein
LIVLFSILMIVLKKRGLKPAVSEDAALAKAAEMPQP